MAGTCAHLWWKGWFHTATEQLAESALDATREAGMAVTRINVTGRNMTRGEDILASLGVQQGDPIFSFSPEAARNAIENLPWVKTASVQRRLPDTLFIEISERQPFALWQHHQKIALVDREGSVLERENLAPFRALKLVVGEDAGRQAHTFLPLLAAQPEIERRTRAAIRMGGRRWDLKMDNGIVVKLPEKDAGFALARLAGLQATHQILERNVATIDLRLPERISVQVAGNHDNPIRLSGMRKEGATP